MSQQRGLLSAEKGVGHSVPITAINFDSNKAIYTREKLIIEGGRIKECRSFDGLPDLFATSGFINCHVHWFMDGGTHPFENLIADIAGNPEKKVAQALEYMKATLKLGITFACDKAPPGLCGPLVYPGIMKAMNRGAMITHSLFSTWAMMSTNGFGAPYARMITSLKEMELALIEMASTGASAIKFIPETPFLKETPHYQFIFDKESFYHARQFAKERNWVFAVHAKGVETLSHCVDVKADCVEHAVEVTPEQLLSFQRNNTFLGPTLDGLLCRLEYAEETGKQMQSATYDWEKVCHMIKGASVLNGGDAFTHMLFSSDGGSFNTPHASLRELYLMRKNGYTPAAVFQAATKNGAISLKQSDRGSIHPGKRADLIFWSKDPLELSLEEWKNLDRFIEAVVLNGKVAFQNDSF